MYQPVTDYSYLAEIKLVNAPAAGQKVNFLDIPQLRSMKGRVIKTIGVAAYNQTDLSVSPNANTVVTSLAGMVLTLAIGSTEEIFQFPCNDLRPAANSGLIRLFKEKQINFPKSYITILAVGALAQNQAVVFNIIYRKEKE